MRELPSLYIKNISPNVLLSAKLETRLINSVNIFSQGRFFERDLKYNFLAMRNRCAGAKISLFSFWDYLIRSNN